MPTEKETPGPDLLQIQNLPDLLLREEAAAFLRVKVDWVNQRMTTGEIPSIKIDGVRRIPKAQFLKKLGIENDLDRHDLMLMVATAIRQGLSEGVAKISFQPTGWRPTLLDKDAL